MFGAFKPSASLSGGLLWKIPWRLSPTQKLRHRRRLRRVDNIVGVLSTALKKASTSSSPSSSSSAVSSIAADQPSVSTNPTSSTSESTTTSTTTTAAAAAAALQARRHGRGPKQGDFVPTLTAHGVHVPGESLLRDVAREAGTMKLLERWRAEMPAEHEMLARDKYTIFDKKVRGYRKGVHKLPKWTRVSQRVNPPGF